MTKIYNSNFPKDLNNYLNLILKNDFFGRSELIIQLCKAKISRIETDLGWKVFVFDLEKITCQHYLSNLIKDMTLP